VCDRHGTGVILRRIFGASPNVLSIRSSRLYPEHLLGQEQLCFDHKGLNRTESFTNVLRILNGNTVRRILCVPFLPDELITALVIKEAFNVPLCVFLMDDNNIHAHGIPDELMREALQKAALRLAISPELRDAYERKYQLKFWVVPPVVDAQAVQTKPQVPNGPLAQARTAVLIGSIWSRAWLDLLRQTIRQSGLKVDWYGNAKASWLKASPPDLERDGITDRGFLAEAELTTKVKEYLFALVPSGTLDTQDDRPEIAKLSLPTRIPNRSGSFFDPVRVWRSLSLRTKGSPGSCRTDLPTGRTVAPARHCRAAQSAVRGDRAGRLDLGRGPVGCAQGRAVRNGFLQERH
jgi:hypothetical protein